MDKDQLEFLPFALPDIGEEEITEVTNTLRSGWVTTGPKTFQFEDDFKKFVGSEYALATNSCTSGLHLALEAIGVGKDDYVITTPYTFTATAEVIRYLGAHPLFCDIDQETYNLDPQEVEKILLENERQGPLKKKIKAIMPVHFAGQSCDMQKIKKLANDYDLKIVEDAAHALPSTSHGEMVGNIGDITVFSFYATKTITTGEGGMITTNDQKLYERMKVMRLHGMDRDAWGRYQSSKGSWFYEIVGPGFKYNMTDIAASLGIHQLRKCHSFCEKRTQLASIYARELKNVSGVKLPVQKNSNDTHSYHLYVIQVEASYRDSIIKGLKDRKIGASVHFIPLHLHPYYRDYYELKPEDFPVSYKVYSQAISLPLYTRMSEKDVVRVTHALKEVIQKILFEKELEKQKLQKGKEVHETSL